jgi:hypothetical protein
MDATLHRVQAALRRAARCGRGSSMQERFQFCNGIVPWPLAGPVVAATCAHSMLGLIFSG